MYAANDIYDFNQTAYIQFETVSYACIGVACMISHLLYWKSLPGRRVLKYLMIGLIVNVAFLSPNNIYTLDTIHTDINTPGSPSYWKELLAGQVLAYIGGGLSFLTLFVPTSAYVSNKGRKFLALALLLAVIGVSLIATTCCATPNGKDDDYLLFAFYFGIPTIIIIPLLFDSVFSATVESANGVIIIVSVYNLWMIGWLFSTRNILETDGVTYLTKFNAGVAFCWFVSTGAV